MTKGRVPPANRDSSEDPPVSVIVPVRDGERWLKECLESVLAQTFQDFYLIVSDNHSSDESLAIAADVLSGFPRARLRSTRRPLEPYEHFSSVLDECDTPLAVILAADDSWHPSFLHDTVTASRVSPDAVCVYSWVEGIDESSVPYSGRTEELSTCSMSRQDAARHMLRHAPPDVMYSLWSRPVLSQILADCLQVQSDIPSYLRTLAINHALVYAVPAYGCIITVPRFLIRQRRHVGASDSAAISNRPYGVKAVYGYWRFLLAAGARSYGTASPLLDTRLLMLRQSAFVYRVYGRGGRFGARAAGAVARMSNATARILQALSRVEH